MTSNYNFLALDWQFLDVMHTFLEYYIMDLQLLLYNHKLQALETQKLANFLFSNFQRLD